MLLITRYITQIFVIRINSVLKVIIIINLRVI